MRLSLSLIHISFFDDCRKLNIKRPDVVEPATSCIDEYIKLISTLLDKGCLLYTST